MRTIVLAALAIAGLSVGTSTIASATPARLLLNGTTNMRLMTVEHVAYYWNHHRYRHRSWDKRRRRWRYY